MVGIKDSNKMPRCCNSCGRWRFNIDDKPICDLTYKYIENIYKKPVDCPLVEAISKADYENRLRADLLAILDEILGNRL